MNPKRETNTGHLKATFDWSDINLQTGIDYMRDKHLSRMEMNGEGYRHKPYQPQQNFTQWGGFVEGPGRQVIVVSLFLVIVMMK